MAPLCLKKIMRDFSRAYIDRSALVKKFTEAAKKQGVILRRNFLKPDTVQSVNVVVVVGRSPDSMSKKDQDIQSPYPQSPSRQFLSPQAASAQCPQIIKEAPIRSEGMEEDADVYDDAETPDQDDTTEDSAMIDESGSAAIDEESDDGSGDTETKSSSSEDAELQDDEVESDGEYENREVNNADAVVDDTDQDTILSTLPTPTEYAGGSKRAFEDLYGATPSRTPELSGYTKKRRGSLSPVYIHEADLEEDEQSSPTMMLAENEDEGIRSEVRT